MDRENGKGIFFGIIGVATLIVAIIGATLAYFSVSSSSQAGVNAQAAVVQINYVDGDQIAVDNLIPASENVALAAYAKTSGQCIDDNDRTVCGVYRFSIENTGADAADITGVLTVDVNNGGKDNIGFSNLSYIVYDVTNENAPSTVKAKSVFPTAVDATTSVFGTDLNATQEIGGGSTRVYEMLIWLNEAGALNDPEQGAKFSASVEVKVSGTQNGQITGQIAGVQ